MSRLPRALGAAALVAAAVALAGIGGTAAAPHIAVADEPAAAVAPHGDPVSAAQAWAAAGAPLAASAAPVPEPCQIFRDTDDLINEVPQSGPRWHMVIAVPRDVWSNPNYHRNGGRELLYAQAAQSIKTIETFYSVRVGTGDVGQLPNQWTMRFDYGTECGPQFPDISISHLPRTQAEYTTEPFFGIVADLDATNLYERSDKRYIVHYAGKSIYCGQSYIYAPSDSSGGAKYSITYNLDNLALTRSHTVLCDWTTDAHEMGHSIGAATGGPRNDDGAHVWDCMNDVMSYGGGICGDRQLYFDFGENNYFGHNGAWNDTDQSAYWCKPTC